MEYTKEDLKKKSDNIADWYTDVILKSEIADYGPARGTMVIRPYGFSIWENVQKVMDEWFKNYGVGNAYFPLLIPMHLLEREKDHIEGFSPQLAVVTHGGGKKLSEALAVRPTSETVMYEMYKKWIKSWRDLPYLINQWNNVVRWELRTYLFLRTSEFLWQEGHTAHESHESAQKMVMKAVDWYKKIYEEYLAIPVVSGKKSESEKFAGAVETFGIELLMPDGKILQGATSHDLGQNFSKTFDIKYQNHQGENQYVWQTSWGLSTRSLGGLFMIHGDDNGVIIPPKIAPIQVVIVPIGIDEYPEELASYLQELGFSVKIDSRDTLTPGRKYNDWELKGVPLRLELGAKEKKTKKVTYVRRDTGGKQTISYAEFTQEVGNILKDIQNNLYSNAKKFLDNNTNQVNSYDDFKKIMKGKRGFIKALWCENENCESKIKEQTKATTRVRSEERVEGGKCIYCGLNASTFWYFGQAY